MKKHRLLNIFLLSFFIAITPLALSSCASKDVTIQLIATNGYADETPVAGSLVVVTYKKNEYLTDLDASPSYTTYGRTRIALSRDKSESISVKVPMRDGDYFRLETFEIQDGVNTLALAPGRQPSNNGNGFEPQKLFDGMVVKSIVLRCKCEN